MQPIDSKQVIGSLRGDKCQKRQSADSAVQKRYDQSLSSWNSPCPKFKLFQTDTA
jgi:hypothetical protein